MNADQKLPMATVTLIDKWAIPIAVSTMLLAFFSALTVFIRHSSHFIADDFDHFSEILTRSFSELLRTPIDVHFVPFHQLESFLIFTLAPLNFDVALGLMISGWVASVFLLHRILRRLVSIRAAWLITLLIGASPVWIHTLIWWSSAAHRIPYLVLQAAAILSYLRFRECQRRCDGLLCATMQILALGFYVKAILFPVILAALELCLAFQARKLSRPGLKLLVGMVAISAVYVIWYLFFAPVMRISMGLGAFETLLGAIKLFLRLGGLLLLLPIDHAWSAWVSGIFWTTLVGLLVWRKPSSVVPIVFLAVLLLINYGLTISGRGGLMLGFPIAAMRYYVDELVVIAVFVALIVRSVPSTSISIQNSLRQKLVLSLMLIIVIGYPVSAYFSNRTLFVKAYANHQRTHDFMVNLGRSLKEASTQPMPPMILDADFPSFAYGFMGSRKSIAEIFGHVYPQLQWLQQPEQARGRVHQIGEDGLLRLAVLSDQPDFRDGISFPGWSIAEETHRWSRDYHATILFSLQPNHKYEGELLVRGPVLGAQRVAVRLNGVAITNINLNESANCCNWSIRFSPDLLRADGLNAFEFDLPDARKPGNGDQRILAIGVQAVQVR
jgi:hypothetical protein